MGEPGAGRIAVKGATLHESLGNLARDLKPVIDEVIKPLSKREYAVYTLLSLGRAFSNGKYDGYVHGIFFNQLVKQEFTRQNSYAGPKEFSKLSENLDRGLRELEELGMVVRKHPNTGEDYEILLSVSGGGESAIAFLRLWLFLHRYDP